MRASEQKIEHTLFLAGAWIKALAGVVESGGGLLVWLVSPHLLASYVILLTAPELSEDPTDVIANYISRTLRHISPDTKAFAGVYLIVHGAIKIVLGAGLLRNKRMAYPLSLGFLGLFVAYQCYRYVNTQSAWLIVLTLFDLVVMWLIWREYRRRGHMVDT